MFSSSARLFSAVALAVALPASAAASVIQVDSYNAVSACVYWADYDRTGALVAGASSTCGFSQTTTPGAYAANRSVAVVNPIGTETAGADQVSHDAITTAGVTSFAATASTTAFATTVTGDPKDFQQALGTSQYRVIFTLTDAYDYVLSSTGASTTTDMGDAINTFFTFNVYDASFTAVASLYGSGNDANILTGSGTLDPGTYQLDARSQTIIRTGANSAGPGGTSTANIAFQLALTPVAAPEPTSVVLLGVGLIGAGVSRWRKRDA